MPIRATAFEVDGYYHFYNRGNNREAIFFERANYLFFLKQVRKYLLPHLSVIAYCLMPTHYHFLVRVNADPQQTSEISEISDVFREGTPPQTSEVFETSEVFREDVFRDDSARISRAMQRFSISYTKAINKRFDRVGGLFQGAFQAIGIQNEAHLLHLCRYIHGNPVKDGLVANPADWPYSNYLEWIDQRDGTLYDPAFVRQYFDTAADYRAFVMDDLHGRDLPEEIKQFLDG